MFRSAVKRALKMFGYQILHTGRPGQDALLDIQAIFGVGQPGVIFDVGANEGQSAIAYANAFPGACIYSFEPYAEAFKKLQKLAVSIQSLRLENCALGDSVRNGTLYVNSASVTNSLLPVAPGAQQFIGEHTISEPRNARISVSTLDVFCRQRAVDYIDILKIDTQGSDLAVLRGGDDMFAKQRVGVVQVEVLFVPLYVGQSSFEGIYAYLMSHGFRLVGIYSAERDERLSLTWADALFVHPAAPEGHRRTSACGRGGPSKTSVSDCEADLGSLTTRARSATPGLYLSWY